MIINYMRKMEELAIKALKETIKNVAVTGGNISIVGDGRKKAIITSTWGQRNVDRKCMMQNKLVQLVNLDDKDITSLHAVEDPTELMSSYSPSFKFRCVFRSSESNSKKKQHLEIWQNNSMKKLYDLTALDVHGDVYTDSEFGCLEWSPCEKKILFVAEKKKAKSEPFLPIPVKPSEDAHFGTEYEYVEEWGEVLVGKSSPVLVLCDTTEDKVSVIPVETAMSLGSARWASDGTIVCLGWETAPRRLGKVYCTNRASHLLHLNTANTFVTLRKDAAMLDPRFSNDGSKLIWLERETGGPHHSCMQLMKMDWDSKEITTVVGTVNDSQSTANKETFYGLFANSLGRCWLNDNSTIVISSIQRASSRLYAINVDTNEVTDLSDCSSNDESFSYNVLDVSQDLVLIGKSSLLSNSSLLLGRFNYSDVTVEWETLIDSTETSPNYHFDVIRLESDVNTHIAKSFSAVYFGPKSGSDVPLIVFPHGGPHSASTNSYSLMSTFFGKMNFAVLYVNYRGSIGAGQASVKSLLGNVGTNDVEDCHQATQQALNKYSNVLSKDKVFIFGGSHGGFLALHLNGQYPSFYKGVAALNPVVDLTTMHFTTDIPDWTAVESGFDYDPQSSIENHFKSMKSKSPIAFVDKVESPTLLLIGKNDLRVPPSQGMSYYHALKARGVPARALVYEDNHGLPKTQHEVDFTINTVLWFLKRLKSEK